MDGRKHLRPQHCTKNYGLLRMLRAREPIFPREEHSDWLSSQMVSPETHTSNTIQIATSCIYAFRCVCVQQLVKRGLECKREQRREYGGRF